MLLARHVGWTCRIARPIDTSDAPPTSAEPAYATRRTARHVVLDVSIRHVRRAASLVGCGTLDMSDAPRRGVGRDTLDTSDAPRHGVGRDTLDTSDAPDTSPCRPDTSDAPRRALGATRSTRPTGPTRRRVDPTRPTGGGSDRRRYARLVRHVDLDVSRHVESTCPTSVLAWRVRRVRHVRHMVNPAKYEPQSVPYG